MTNVMSQKQFTNALNGVIRSASSQRDKIQNLVMDSLNHFVEYGDTTRMTTLVDRVKGVKSLNTTALKQYIESHANVTYTKMKDGSDGFKKQGKGATPEVKTPDVEWYNFRNQTTQPQALVIDQKVTSILKAMKKADENEQEIQVKDKENLKAQLDELYKYTV